MRFVRADQLEPGMVLARSVRGENGTMMLGENVVLTGNFIMNMQARGYLGAYIKDEFSEKVNVKETISEKLFFEGVKAVREENIGQMVNVAKEIVAEIFYAGDVTYTLLQLRAHDDYTYQHSVSVALLSAVIAKKMHLDRIALEDISIAGICHDLGKLQIPIEILNKPARLTAEEYEVIKTHSRKSFEILSDRYDIHARIKQAVLFHHENENGSGYPEGREGDQIPLMAKIIHAADVYDALVTKRVYKDAYSPADALEYMISGSNILFDPDVVKALCASVPVFTPGTEVVLSNGEMALVIENTSQPMRPIVRLFSNKQYIDLSSDPDYQDILVSHTNAFHSGYAEDVAALSKLSEYRKDVCHTILVVDDMVTSLMRIKNILSDNYKLILVKSGEQALHYINTTGVPDLLIMDIDMPEIDGIKTYRTIYDMYGKVPSIFVTSLNDKKTILECKSLGTLDYIIKPVQPIYLRERVELALLRQGER